VLLLFKQIFIAAIVAARPRIVTAAPPVVVAERARTPSGTGHEY